MFANAARQMVLAALGLIAALTLSATPVRAEPALWVVKDADTTLYLFGTVHLLRPEVTWRSPRIDQAFKSSDELWVEIPADDDPAAMQQLVVKYGLAPGAPLSDRLDPANKARLAKAAESSGVPLPVLNMFRPWTAAVTLALAPLVKAGYDPEKGVDKVLLAQAKAAGKPVRAFETPEQQIRMLAGLSPRDELLMLTTTLEDVEEGPALVDDMAAAWAAGDLESLDSKMIVEMKREAPGVYAAILVDRNATWVKQIETLMAGSGTHFVAVGAAHLAGADSVQAMLTARGYKITRE